MNQTPGLYTGPGFYPRTYGRLNYTNTPLTKQPTTDVCRCYEVVMVYIGQYCDNLNLLMGLCIKYVQLSHHVGSIRDVAIPEVRNCGNRVSTGKELTVYVTCQRSVNLNRVEFCARTTCRPMWITTKTVGQQIFTVARDRDSDSERLFYFGRVIYFFYFFSVHQIFAVPGPIFTKLPHDAVCAEIVYLL